MTKKSAAPPPIALAVETVRRLGLRVSDVLVSEAWDLPYQLTAIDETAAVVFVDRLVPNGGGTWRASINIMLKYLPRDVRARDASVADDEDNVTVADISPASSVVGEDFSISHARASLAADEDTLADEETVTPAGQPSAPLIDDGDKRGNSDASPAVDEDKIGRVASLPLDTITLTCETCHAACRVITNADRDPSKPFKCLHCWRAEHGLPRTENA